jgi:hypothetical protein
VEWSDVWCVVSGVWCVWVMDGGIALWPSAPSFSRGGGGRTAVNPGPGSRVE